MSKVGHWLNNSVVSRIARGPGFESRSGHDFFLPCDMYNAILPHINVSDINSSFILVANQGDLHALFVKNRYY